MELRIAFSGALVYAYSLQYQSEKIFSLMNRIKTYLRASLSQPILCSLIIICMEGPECDLFHPTPAITLWNDSVKARRPNRKKVEIINKENTK